VDALRAVPAAPGSGSAVPASFQTDYSDYNHLLTLAREFTPDRDAYLSVPQIGPRWVPLAMGRAVAGQPGTSMAGPKIGPSPG